ncbi:MAG TPA: hypothetical protein VEA44_08030 [Caulobacter sp.]|nr:hypothetical protein [Caulobacter sp.]
MNDYCSEEDTYPSDADLMLTSSQYRIPATYTPHPDEPDIIFAPERAEVRILSVRPKTDTTDGDPPHSLDFYCLSASVSTPNGLEDARYIIRRLYEIGFDRPDHNGQLNFDRNLADIDVEVHGKKITFTKISPYDFEFDQQCYLIIILDPRVNWQFMANGRGVTTKSYYGADNFGVSFVTRKLVKTGQDEHRVLVDFSDPNTCFGAPEGCKILLFGVARRRADTTPPVPGYNSRQGFNFHIEFKWEARLDPIDPKKIIPAMRLPTIFDPDVPNSGGSSIP